MVPRQRPLWSTHACRSPPHDGSGGESHGGRTSSRRHPTLHGAPHRANGRDGAPLIPIMASQGVSARTAAWQCGLQLFVTVPLYVVLGWAADHCPNRWCSWEPGTSALLCWPPITTAMALLLAFVVLLAICDASAHARGAGRRGIAAPDVQSAPGRYPVCDLPGVPGAPVFLGVVVRPSPQLCVAPLALHRGVAGRRVDLRGPQATHRCRDGVRQGALAATGRGGRQPAGLGLEGMAHPLRPRVLGIAGHDLRAGSWPTTAGAGPMARGLHAGSPRACCGLFSSHRGNTTPLPHRSKPTFQRI